MIEITEFKKINVGCKIAEFDVKLDSIGIIFRGMALLQKGERRWVSFASKSRAGETSPVYFQCSGFLNESTEKEFLKAVLLKIEAEFLTAESPSKLPGITFPAYDKNSADLPF